MKKNEWYELKAVKIILFLIGIQTICFQLNKLFKSSENYIQIFFFICLGIVFISYSLNFFMPTVVKYDNYEKNNNVKQTIWWKRIFGFCIDFFIVYFIFFIFAGSPMLYDRKIDFNFYILYFSYYFILESIWSSTLGKLIYSSKVVNKYDYSKPSLLQIVFRTVSRIVPFGFHDVLSETDVIENNK